MEVEQVPEDRRHKKGRHRKKQLYNSILQLMEFYFSDSNLTKDRFLSQLIRSDPYIDIGIFLRFNKIRKLTSSIKDVVKAVSKSKLIELSEDKTKVYRKAPIGTKENVEECTIYVERLKSDATHDWLTSIFSEFGNVVYVSIPKYKHNGMIKGFAFVEFENEEGAKAALQYFESIDCKIPSYIEPEKLCSIATFEGGGKNAPLNKNNRDKENTDAEMNEEGQKLNENKQKKLVENEQKSSEHQQKSSKEEEKLQEVMKQEKFHEKNGKTEKTNEDKQNGTETNEGVPLKNKRKHSNSETNECEEQHTLDGKLKKKKAKIEQQSETIEGVRPEILPKDENTVVKKRKHSETKTNEDEQQEASGVVKKKPKIEGETETNEGVPQEAMLSEGEGEEKKKKKNKKSHRKKINLKEIGLQILSKRDWKKMRNRYLDMQRKTMQKLKMHLSRQRFSNNYETKKKFHPKDKIPPHEENPNMEVVEENNDTGKNLQSQFIPGTIVKVSLSEPCEDNKKLKTEVKACSSEIKFVDIPQPIASEEIYVRFSDNENARAFCGSSFKKGEMSILEGTEEEKYWEKIGAERQAKQKKTAGKQRGRDKILKKAERQLAKHVRFDDNDSE